MRNWALETPANGNNGGMVLQGHADYCRDNGCMSYNIDVDGVERGFCARCGKVYDVAVTDEATATEAFTVRIHCDGMIVSVREFEHEHMAEAFWASACDDYRRRDDVEGRTIDMFDGNGDVHYSETF